LIKYTEGEDRHKMMNTISKGQHRWYKRLNVNKGLEDMKLDNWEKGEWKNPQTGVKKVVPGGKSLQRMENATFAYLDRDEIERKLFEYAPPKVVLQQVAERLVRHRRMREANRSENVKRWETYMGQYLTGDRLDEEDAMVRRDENTITSPSQSVVIGRSSANK